MSFRTAMRVAEQSVRLEEAGGVFSPCLGINLRSATPLRVVVVVVTIGLHGQSCAHPW